MKKNNISERRKFRIVKMDFQLGFIMKFYALIIFAAAIVGVAVYALSAGSSTTVFENSRLIIKPTSDFLLPVLLFSCLAAIVTAGVVTVFLTMLISHRISGPIYRIEKDMAEVEKGNLRVTFGVRSHDELKDLAKSINRTLQSVRETIAAVDKDLNDIPLSALQGNELYKIADAKKQLKKFTI
jgi:methyl-accepting chemotaxis protein